MTETRKAVSFSASTMVTDGDTITTGALNGDKTTAEAHSADPSVEEVSDMFKDLVKKKKKKTLTKKDEDAAGADAVAVAVGDDGEIDMSALKKKKKKKPKADDFEAKLAEVGEIADGDVVPASKKEKVQQGDMHLGTGIWDHNETEQINYSLLLDRFFEELAERAPDLMGGSLKSTKIPPPQCLREGNKKTIWANLPEIAKKLKRNDEHIIQYLFAELGTNGSVDGSKRLVIKGKFQSKQIENILRRYIQEYVSCKTCRSLNTELAKGENRLWYITCNSCASRRTVPPINRGFSALVGKRKKQQQG